MTRANTKVSKKLLGKFGKEKINRFPHIPQISAKYHFALVRDYKSFSPHSCWPWASFIMMVKNTSEAKIKNPKSLSCFNNWRICDKLVTCLLLKYLYVERGGGVRELGVNYPYCWLSTPAHAFRGGLHTYAQFGLSLHIFHFYDEWCLDSALKHCESFGQDLQFGIRGVLKLAREVPADIYANLSLSQQNLFANFNKIPMIF